MKRGFLLAAAGLALAWFLDLGSVGDFLAASLGPAPGALVLPGWAIGAAGTVLLVAGAALVFQGRRPFEYSLGGKAAIALILLPLSALLTFLALRFLLGRLAEFRAAGDPLGIAWMFKSVLLWEFVLPSLGVLGVLLLAHDLQNERGLRLAFYGVLVFAAAGLATLVAGWLPIDASVSTFGTSAFDPPTFTRTLGLSLLPQRFADLAWRAVFVVVCLRTHRRIARWEIPIPPETRATLPAPGAD